MNMLTGIAISICIGIGAFHIGGAGAGLVAGLLIGAVMVGSFMSEMSG